MSSGIQQLRQSVVTQSLTVEGQCHCGQITFEAEIDPAADRMGRD